MAPGAEAVATAASGPHLPMVAHVIRRLGIGANAHVALAAKSVDDAIATAMDLSSPPAPLPEFPPPESLEDARGPGQLQDTIAFWVSQMASSPRLIEERLVWFWHDHFATSMRKVRIGYLMYRQHQTVRENATGRFDLLLKAIAKDPAMLLYLDGRVNTVDSPNENFAREVMELHTLGRGHYTQDDVVAASRAFTGWVMVPEDSDRRRFVTEAEPWSSVFVPQRHDAGSKTLLGITANLDMDGALDVLLEHPATGVSVASKLYEELVGLRPDESTAESLGASFRNDYEIMPLVEKIVSDPRFLSEEAVWSRIRTPMERLAGILQGFETHDQVVRHATAVLDAASFVPFFPPNPAGFPSGSRLLGPHQLVHTLDYGALIGPRPTEMTAEEVLAGLGIFDPSPQSVSVIAAAGDPISSLGLAAASPEYALT
jgi:uncharacterized protein (DUF1800 family)